MLRLAWTVQSPTCVDPRALQGLEAPPRTSTSHLVTDPGSRPSATQPRTELNVETRSTSRTMEAARGNGYAPVQGLPVMMMMMIVMLHTLLTNLTCIHTLFSKLVARIFVVSVWTVCLFAVILDSAMNQSNALSVDITDLVFRLLQCYLKFVMLQTLAPHHWPSTYWWPW